MSHHFSFKEVDPEGEETLHTVARAMRFNRWMYDTIQPRCSGRILEIGSGIGNISQFFIRDNYDIVLSDVRDQYCNNLKKKYPDLRVELIDLVKSRFEHVYKNQLESYDTIFALNVIEHIEDDYQAIANLQKLLKPGGTCIILVPAFDFLYNSFDADLFHFRRYNRDKLKNLLSSQLEITHTQYFNFVGMFGWYLNGNLLKKKLIPSGQMSIFDKLVPLFRSVDFITGQLCGLSVIAVGTKPE